jgi:hypothetical protein
VQRKAKFSITSRFEGVMNSTHSSRRDPSKAESHIILREGGIERNKIPESENERDPIRIKDEGSQNVRRVRR